MINSTIIIIKEHVDNSDLAKTRADQVMQEIKGISDRISKYSILNLTENSIQILVDFEGYAYDLKDDIEYSKVDLPIDVINDFSLLNSYH